MELGTRIANKNTLVVRGIVLGALALVAFAGTLTVLNALGNKGYDAEVYAAQQSVGFPLYHPKKLPSGFTPTKDGSSGTVRGGVVNLTVETWGKKVVISQQARPKLMEEVTKTKEWVASIGKAYIANLNEHVTGFIVTDKTLIIFSSADTVDTARLTDLMNSMVAL